MGITHSVLFRCADRCYRFHFIMKFNYTDTVQPSIYLQSLRILAGASMNRVLRCAHLWKGNRDGLIQRILIIICPRTGVLYAFLSGTNRMKRYFYSVYFMMIWRLFYLNAAPQTRQACSNRSLWNKTQKPRSLLCSCE